MWRPTREDVITALGAAAWTAAFLHEQPGTAAAVLPLVTTGLLVHRRHPAAGALAVLAAMPVATSLGVPSDNPALLLPGLAAVYALGRYAHPRAGIAISAAFVVAAMYADEFSVATGMFVTGLLAVPWVFGRVVRARADAAAAARTAALHLEEQDPAAVAAAVVAEERARLSVEAVAVVRRAVTRMLAGARLARSYDEPDPALLAGIQQEGATAVAELRRLLGLLRSGPPRDATPDAPSTGSAPAPAGPQLRLRDAVFAGAVLALALVEVAGAGTPEPSVLALGAALAAVPLIRRRAVSAACLWAAASLMLTAAVTTREVLGLAQVVVVVWLAWSAAREGHRRDWTCLSVLAAAALAWSYRTNPDNVAMTSVLLALPAFAGHAWRRSARVEEEADRRGARLRATLDRAVAAAVRAERLRLAHELHDVASHAVGVMVLHASAAQAQLAVDRERAKASIDEIVRAGSTAGTELDRLSDVLHQTTPDVSLDQSGVPGDGLDAALDELVGRIAATGIRTTLRRDGTSLAPAAQATVYRVVQEALTNTVRHSGAQRVEISVTTVDDAVQVDVVDDGRGVAGRTVEPGFGLVGLAERLRGQGGALTYGEEPGGGFRLTAVVPTRSVQQRESVGP